MAGDPVRDLMIQLIQAEREKAAAVLQAERGKAAAEKAAATAAAVLQAEREKAAAEKATAEMSTAVLQAENAMLLQAARDRRVRNNEEEKDEQARKERDLWVKAMGLLVAVLGAFFTYLQYIGYWDRGRESRHFTESVKRQFFKQPILTDEDRESFVETPLIGEIEKMIDFDMGRYFLFYGHKSIGKVSSRLAVKFSML